MRMTFYPVFLSLVCVVQNQSIRLESIILDISEKLDRLVSDYEIIIVDNASQDNSVSVLKGLTTEAGLPNLQVYALTKMVDADTASWVGLENALGDFVAVFDPATDDISFLSTMLERAVTGADVVFAANEERQPQSIGYRIAYTSFNVLYKYFNGIDLANEAPQYRILSKRIVNFILQHPQPALTYRHLPATGGFSKAVLNYSAKPKTKKIRHLGGNVDRGMRLLVSTTRAPMRMVTTLSLFGAVANLLYSIYVLFVAFFKDHVAEGWVSLSLQQSGMFFLISLVLLVLGEYILNMASLSNEGPLYHVGQEFTSARMTRREKLNVEDTSRSTSSVEVKFA